MLLRAYRLTDKFSLASLKLASVFAELMSAGAAVVLGFLASILAVVLGILLAIGRQVFAVFLILLGAIGGGIRKFSQGTSTVVTSGASRVQERQSGAMARRAMQAEVDVAIVEDPLKTQNRILGFMVLVMLVALIGIVFWATSPRAIQPTVVADADMDISGMFAPTEAIDVSGNGDDSPPALAIATAIPTATQIPEVFRSSGSIAFTVRENGQNDLWAVAVGSRQPIRITNDLADERDPAWSPNGTRLAYASNRDGNWELYIYDLQTDSTERKTFNLSFEANPSWSPDGNWLAYETYQAGNLDVYVLPVTDVNASLEPITVDTTAEFTPAWSPNGRNIVFTSWRDDAQDLFVVSLDDVSVVTNLTNTPNRHEDHAQWHPDGDLIAYSALDEGLEKIFVKSISRPGDAPEVIGLGREPSWSPDGNSIIAAVDSSDSTHLTVYPYSGDLSQAQIIAVPPRATSPVWTDFPLPVQLVNSGGLPLRAPTLYLEQESPFADGRYPLGALINGVDAPEPSLSDRVNDSFNAFREAVLEQSGRDFVANLSDAFWSIDQRPQPGENPRNWHYTGRAFSIDRNAALVGFPQTIEIVREERNSRTYWRVFLRVDEEAQSGQLGEPLRQMPWDISSRFENDVEAYDAGGRLKREMPQGYYLDLTLLVEDYGWQPLAAESDWRLNFNAMNYWAFYKPDNLSWLDAMLEIWNIEQLGALAPTPTPFPTPEPEA